MSEERFNQIDEELRGVHERFDRIDQEFRGVDERFDRIEGEIRGLRGEMHERRDEQGRQMRVLYEDMVARLAAVSERDAVSRSELRDALAADRAVFERRIEPLEGVVRTHSTDIAALKRGQR